MAWAVAAVPAAGTTVRSAKIVTADRESARTDTYGAQAGSLASSR